MNPLAAFRVILVKPREPGNVGSAARAIANFGLGELVLVQPAPRRRYRAQDETSVTSPSLLDHPMARAMAAGGGDVLARARVMPTLEAALADCSFAAAHTARSAFRRGASALAPRGAAPTLLGHAAQGPVALVFGPEDRGLTRAEVESCDVRVRIPAGEEYPVLNLAGAVLVAAYELSECVREAQGGSRERAPEDASTVGERDRLAAALAAALEAIDYPQARRAPGLARFERMLSRANLTRPEYSFLLGVLQRIDGTKKQGV